LVQLLRDKFSNSPFPVKALHWLVDFRKSIAKDINAGDVYVGLENIDGATGDYVPTEAKESIGSAAIFERGDILFPKLRPYLFGLNTTQQRRLIDNLILIWHKNRAAQDHEKAGTQETVDVRFDLKDWSALRFSEPNELRKSLAAALVEHYSPLNT
jgi:hypothetical protein